MNDIIELLPKKDRESWIENSLDDERENFFKAFSALSISHAAATAQGEIDNLPNEQVFESLVWLNDEIDKLNQLKLESEKKKHLAAIRKTDS